MIGTARRVLRWGLVLVVLLALDQGARILVERQIEQRADDQLRGVAGIDVSIDSFPFLARLMVFGEVAGIDARIDELVGSELRFGSAGLRLNGVAIDRARVVSEREVVLERLDSGSAYAELTDDELSRVLPGTYRVEPGRVVVEVAGVEVDAEVAMRDGVLMVSPLGLDAVSLPVPSHSVLPCATEVVALAGRLRVSCGLERVPPELVERINRAGG